MDFAAWVVGAARVFAVSEVGAAALHLIRASGSALDAVADLVVSDQTNVHVFDGQKVAELEPGPFSRGRRERPVVKMFPCAGRLCTKTYIEIPASPARGRPGPKRKGGTLPATDSRVP
jgi:hypothetical protein